MIEQKKKKKRTSQSSNRIKTIVVSNDCMHNFLYTSAAKVQKQLAEGVNNVQLN